MRTGAVDPGKNFIGWAVVNGDVLVDCGLEAVTSLAEVRRFVERLGLDSLVVEQPQVYFGKKNKGDANDLIRLANVVGACGAATLHRRASVRLVAPAHWKGQVPKKIHHDRIQDKLSDLETRVLAVALYPIDKNLRHNVLDAVGLALWATGRKS